jgi:intracellular septation protein A
MSNLLVNIALPILILLTLSSEDRLGPVPALLLAVAIPVVFGIRSLLKTRKVQPATIFGIVSVMLTGMIGVLELDTRYFAIKEGGVPITFALLVLFSNWTRFPIVKLLADQVIVKSRVEAALTQRDAHDAYRTHLKHAGIFWACILITSGIIKFSLASWIVTSPSGTVAFNQELAKLEAIHIPTSMTFTMVLMLVLCGFIIRGIGKITGLSYRESFRGGERVASIAGRFGRTRHQSA